MILKVQTARQDSGNQCELYEWYPEQKQRISYHVQGDGIGCFEILNDENHPVRRIEIPSDEYSRNVTVLTERGFILLEKVFPQHYASIKNDG